MNDATDIVLFDFTSASATPAWLVVNDNVMGGVSTSRFDLTHRPAEFRGEVSLENGGGFASVRSLWIFTDLAGCGCFVVRVRGDGHRYKFTVRTAVGTDAPVYQCPFTTKSGDWEEHRLAFKDFVPTFRGRVLTDAPALEPGKVICLGFLIADKQSGPFQLEIAWVRASACTPRMA